MGLCLKVAGLDTADVAGMLKRQLACNTAIAEEGLHGQYGASIGRVMLDTYGDGVRNRAVAMAAAGSDARMNGGDEEMIAHTVVNALNIVSGIICDGAKASCAAKIASSVEAGLLGWEMYRHGKQFVRGDSIVAENAERCIRNIGRLGKEGMRETNREILKIMPGET